MNVYFPRLLKIAVGSLMLIRSFIACDTSRSEEEPPLPNIIILYADDLGYGDLSSYGASELNTPNIDRIASEGLRFTNGYATSATCTPSRYALLTGQYPWRNKRAHVLPGNAPLIIDTAMVSLPDIMKMAGYRTGIVGKWHLGLGGENLDWNGKISPGPNDIGFDQSFILASTNDRVPTVYVENEHVFRLDPEDPLEVNYRENFPGEPTGRENPELLRIYPSHGHDKSIVNGISRIGYMRGGRSARWVDENMGDSLLDRSLRFIRDSSEPFFLFYSFPQPHVPRTPHQRFAGRSGMGPRGDAILEVDHAVGKILAELASLEIDRNTLIIFSSDNGPVLDDGYLDSAVLLLGDHRPAGILRGGKYSLFEAGTRVPYMVRWPGKIKAGVSSALISQHDLHASLASLLGVVSLSYDSQDLLETLLGKDSAGREKLILEARGKTALRWKNYAMIPPYPGPEIIPWGPRIETGQSEEYQLYDLQKDPSQKNNLAEEDPELLERLKAIYAGTVRDR